MKKLLLLSLILFAGGTTHKIASDTPIYFSSEGTPIQCGPVSYYGAVCFEPDGIPKPPTPPKGFFWALIPEEGK